MSNSKTTQLTLNPDQIDLLLDALTAYCAADRVWDGTGDFVPAADGTNMLAPRADDIAALCRTIKEAARESIDATGWLGAREHVQIAIKAQELAAALAPWRNARRMVACPRCGGDAIALAPGAIAGFGNDAGDACGPDYCLTYDRG